MVLKRMAMFLLVLCFCAFTAMPMSVWAASGTTLAAEGSISANSARKLDESAGTAYDMSDTGTVLIVNAAAGTGEKLSGAGFAVYENGHKVTDAEINGGETKLDLPEGEYYLRQQKTPSGYLPEKTSISFSVLWGKTTVVDITSELDLENVNPQDIIPKTGETVPVRIYACSIFCLMTAALCGIKLRHPEKRHGKGII